MKSNKVFFKEKPNIINIIQHLRGKKTIYINLNIVEKQNDNLEKVFEVDSFIFSKIPTCNEFIDSLFESNLENNISIDECLEIEKFLNIENLYNEIQKKSIILYDKSKNIDEFILNGISGWWDKYDRLSISNAIDSAKDNGDKTFIAFIGDKSIEMSIENWLIFMKALEYYAYNTYKITQLKLRGEKIEYPSIINMNFEDVKIKN